MFHVGGCGQGPFPTQASPTLPNLPSGSQALSPAEAGSCCGSDGPGSWPQEACRAAAPRSPLHPPPSLKKEAARGTEKTSMSGFITTRCFQIQKKGTGQGAECGCAGGGVLGQERHPVQRDWELCRVGGVGGAGPTTSPPLDLQQVLGGGGVHSGVTPNARARGRVRGWEGWGPAPPCLRQCVEVTGEGLVPGPGPPPPGQERGWPGQDLPSHCSCYFGVTSASRARAPHTP